MAPAKPEPDFVRRVGRTWERTPLLINGFSSRRYHRGLRRPCNFRSSVRGEVALAVREFEAFLERSDYVAGEVATDDVADCATNDEKHFFEEFAREIDIRSAALGVRVGSVRKLPQLHGK